MSHVLGTDDVSNKKIVEFDGVSRAHTDGAGFSRLTLTNWLTKMNECKMERIFSGTLSSSHIGATVIR